MGTTRDAFLSGSASFAYVALVEGYSVPLSNCGDSDAVIAALTGTDWADATTVHTGLYVDLSINQAISPDEPMLRMGECTLWVVPTPGDDAFGVALAKKTSAFETYLDATLDNDDTTVTVKSTSGLSGGYVHIGTECIAYAGTTATTLTGCTRGKFSPFGSYDDSLTSYTSRNFSHYHRVGADASNVNLAPVVTSSPRTWVGRWVRVTAHRVVNGVLDTLAEAETVFAGKILDTRDDPNTFATVLQLKGVTEVFADSVVGASQWEGFATDTGGVYLEAGQTFAFADDDGTGSNSITLTVVPGTPADATEIQTGTYSLEDLTSAMSAWLADGAGTLAGSYEIASPVTIPPSGELRTKIYWTLVASGLGIQVVWALAMPPAVAQFFGFDDIDEVDGSDPTRRVVRYVGAGSANREHWHRGGEPNRVIISLNGGLGARCTFTTKSGTAVDQLDTMPNEFKPILSTVIGGNWGVFILGDSTMVSGRITDNADGTITIDRMAPVLSRGFTFLGFGSSAPVVKFSASSKDVLAIRQIYAFESDPVLILMSLALSCGTGSYNNPYLQFPINCGASIPYELVDGMIDSITRIPSMGGTIATIIEKPTKMSDLVRSDLMFRWVFLMWKDGGMECGSWRTPTTSLAEADLTEANKGAPAGNEENHRSASQETSEWLRPIVKIRYNRDATDPKGDAYKSTIQFEDATAVDDAGGAANTVTISLRNTYSEFANTGQSVESLLDDYLAMMPLVSRPALRLTRSISPALFLAIAPGSIVRFTDSFARDPETGTRGITERPALVTRVRYNFGGFTAGSDEPQPMGGEVDLLFTDMNPDRVGAPYVPSAMLNDLYTLGSFDHGYDATNFKLHVLTNRFSETTDTGGRDSASFNAGDKILIIERDPADPDAPTKWERTIASVTGDEITMTAALSSPAWDNTKQYYVISQTYSAATADQHVHAYQADSADGLIEDTAQPYLYGTGGADSTFTTNTGLAAVYPFEYVNYVEMPPSTVRIDGAGRDVAHEAALVRLVNNLTDYKTATQQPMLGAVTSNTSATGTSYLLVDYFPVFLTAELLSNAVYRYLTVAPWAYSTDGTSTKCRVTLSRERPSFPTTTDVAWAGTYAQYEWTGITSTTPGTLADGTLAVNVKNPTNGLAWVAIELGYKCATRGLAKFIEGIRQTA